MKTLKKIIQGKLLWLTAVIMVAILIIATLFQVLATQLQAREQADATFKQVHKIIENNETELQEVKEEYRKTCLLNAEAISYIIDQNPALVIANEEGTKGKNISDEQIEEFKIMAQKLDVDEIHIFDQTGRIFAGTHKIYFDMTFDSGEQIGYFKPLLTNKDLSIVQDITPNTAEGVLVQYSAQWGKNKQYIVQVGMYPEAVLAATEKNELSYIFSLLRGNPGVSLYAVSANEGKIIGSPAGMYNGNNLSEIGLDFSQMSHYEKGAHVKVNGVNSYCFFEEANGTLIGYIIANDQLYGNMSSFILILALCLALIATVLVFIMLKYSDHYIIKSIADTNTSLRMIAEGNLEEKVNVHTTAEFSELSTHINRMIRTLLADTDKMSEVLNRTNLHIGVYEYNTNMTNARFTDHISEIFGLNEREMAALAADNQKLQEFVDRLRSEPIENEENTYRFVGKTERYIKLEEVYSDNDVLGIVMDVTEETVSRKLAEAERDVDILTGAYNRRGMERQLKNIFANPNDVQHGALIMIDCDNLKHINDHYGHPMGDVYLQKVAEILQSFEAPKSVVARSGGDEFVLLIYGYETDAAVEKAMAKISEIQATATVTLAEDERVPLLFSYGFEQTRGRGNYELMLALADERMYLSKRIRKQGTLA